MGIIVNMLIPGGRSQDITFSCVTGIAAAAVSRLPAIGVIQPVPPLSWVRVMRGHRARWPAWRLGAPTLRNGGCAEIEEP
jgi:hypothetical protein